MFGFTETGRPMAPSDVEADAAESVCYQAIAFKEGTVLVMLTVMHVGGAG